MNDGTQAYVNVIVMAYEKIMGDPDDDSRDHALQILARRLMRLCVEADVNPLEYADPEWLSGWLSPAAGAADA